MLKSISPEDHNGHLRSLIDQRNARADVHGRLSAVSDFSDTPSVYTHSYFSPRPSERGASRIGYGYGYSSSISDVGPERYEPHRSMLDLTDDRRASCVSGDYDNTNPTSSEELTDESETTTRMSYLGPKMRVHSRAPWEEEALQEVDEENVPGSPTFLRKHAAKGIVSAFSSPRPSFAGSVSRQSEDSSISQLATKRSFETINSQVSLSHTRRGLYTLAQESTSSNLLGSRTPVKETFLNKLSIGRLRSDTSATTHAPNTPPTPMSSLIPTSASTQSSPIRTTSPSSSHDSLEFLSFRKASTHPYANPDLVVPYPERIQDASTPSDTLPHCDSEVTVMESFSMGSTANYNPQARISIPNSSVNSVASKFRTSPISTKSISSPVTAICSPQNLHGSGAERSLPGWTERSPSAPFALISLEEARAKRMRTSTDTGAATSSCHSATPFPGNSTDYTTSSSSSPLTTLARGRSVSAGANAKHSLHNTLWQPKLESQGSESTRKDDFIPGPPFGKTLKNKKSGFMRIFNRDKDLQSAPPVPSIPDGISQLQSGQHLAAPMHRVPVLSSSQREVSIGQNSSLQADTLSTNKNTKRSSPSLSIHTTTQASPARPTISSRPHATLGVPSAEPQSAPADLPEFPILKLRPVSMLFSASFGDFVPSDPPEMAATPRPYIPPSSKLPITPISPSRPYDIPSAASPAAGALQEQILPAKNAWQRHIWELEGQVRALKSELEHLNNNDEYCDKCGRGKKPPEILNRHRAGTGTSRLVNPRT